MAKNPCEARRGRVAIAVSQERSRLWARELATVSGLSGPQIDGMISQLLKLPLSGNGRTRWFEKVRAGQIRPTFANKLLDVTTAAGALGRELGEQHSGPAFLVSAPLWKLLSSDLTLGLDCDIATSLINARLKDYGWVRLPYKQWSSLCPSPDLVSMFGLFPGLTIRPQTLYETICFEDIHLLDKIYLLTLLWMEAAGSSFSWMVYRPRTALKNILEGTEFNALFQSRSSVTRKNIWRAAVRLVLDCKRGEPSAQSDFVIGCLVTETDSACLRRREELRREVGSATSRHIDLMNRLGYESHQAQEAMALLRLQAQEWSDLEGMQPSVYPAFNTR